MFEFFKLCFRVALTFFFPLLRFAFHAISCSAQVGKILSIWCVLLSGVVATTDAVEGCTGVNVAVMVGGFPRKEGMERKDVMSKNVSIYKSQAAALEKHAAPNCKVMGSVSLF